MICSRQDAWFGSRRRLQVLIETGCARGVPCASRRRRRRDRIDDGLGRKIHDVPRGRTHAAGSGEQAAGQLVNQKKMK
jgi:hypothetical protein